MSRQTNFNNYIEIKIDQSLLRVNFESLGIVNLYQLCIILMHQYDIWYQSIRSENSSREIALPPELDENTLESMFWGVTELRIQLFQISSAIKNWMSLIENEGMILSPAKIKELISFLTDIKETPYKCPTTAWLE